MIKIVNAELLPRYIIKLTVVLAKITVKSTVLCLVLAALWWGLPTTWGTLEIDIFPVGVYLK